MSLLLVRERPPLRLHATISAPDGSYYRWGPDDHKAERAGSALTFSTVMPGGFDQASLVLARDPSIEYSDLQQLSTVTLRGAGGRIAWQGRMETTPRTSGDQMSISPGLVGWQAHLEDDTSARMIYVDNDRTAWQGGSVTRHKNLTEAHADMDDGSSGPDWTTGAPSDVTGWSSSWTRWHLSELWYDTKGIPLGFINYVLTNVRNSDATYTVSTADPNWNANIFFCTDDVASAFTPVGSGLPPGLLANGVTSGFASAIVGRPWLLLQLAYAAAAGTDGITYAVYWQVQVVGQNSVDILTHGGALASQVEADALRRWAPKLAFSVGGSIQPSSWVISQLKYMDPTTCGTIIKDVNKYELRDWAVWEGPTYYSNDFNTRGRLWQTRVREAKLQETGPQATRLFNGVMVTYTDITGIVRQVGPPGSGDGTSNTEDPSLVDLDPLNPLNELGIRKWGQLQLQTSVQADAIQAGARFLQYQKLLNTSGQASIVGHLQDMNGVWWPAYMVRAGDQISFVDAGDFSFRRIVSTSYDDSSKTNQIQLDSPPDGMQALLERFSTAIAPGGFS